MSKSYPYAQIAIGSALISFAGVFVKLSTSTPLADAFYRMLFAGIILTVYNLYRKESYTNANLQTYQVIFLAGFFFGVDLTFWHSSIDIVGPGLATVLVNLQAFFLASFAFFFIKERLSKFYFLALLLAAIGLYCLVGYKWHVVGIHYKVGVFEGILASLFYACYVINLRKSQMLSIRLTPVANMTLVCLSSTLVLGIISCMTHISLAISSCFEAGLLIAYALFAQVLGWSLISLGLPKTKMSVAGVLLLLQPVLTMIWDIIFFHRQTPMIEILGSALLLLSIYLSRR